MARSTTIRIDITAEPAVRRIIEAANDLALTVEAEINTCPQQRHGVRESLLARALERYRLAVATIGPRQHAPQRETR